MSTLPGLLSTTSLAYHWQLVCLFPPFSPGWPAWPWPSALSPWSVVHCYSNGESALILKTEIISFIELYLNRLTTAGVEQGHTNMHIHKLSSSYTPVHLLRVNCIPAAIDSIFHSSHLHVAIVRRPLRSTNRTPCPSSTIDIRN